MRQSLQQSQYWHCCHGCILPGCDSQVCSGVLLRELLRWGPAEIKKQEPQSVLDKNSDSNMRFRGSSETNSSVSYQHIGKVVHVNHFQANVRIIGFNNQTQMERAIQQLSPCYKKTHISHRTWQLCWWKQSVALLSASHYFSLVPLSQTHVHLPSAPRLSLQNSQAQRPVPRGADSPTGAGISPQPEHHTWLQFPSR